MGHARWNLQPYGAVEGSFAVATYPTVQRMIGLGGRWELLSEKPIIRDLAISVNTKAFSRKPFLFKWLHGREAFRMSPFIG